MSAVLLSRRPHPPPHPSASNDSLDHRMLCWPVRGATPGTRWGAASFQPSQPIDAGAASRFTYRHDAPRGGVVGGARPFYRAYRTSLADGTGSALRRMPRLRPEAKNLPGYGVMHNALSRPDSAPHAAFVRCRAKMKTLERHGPPLRTSSVGATGSATGTGPTAETDWTEVPYAGARAIRKHPANKGRRFGLCAPSNGPGGPPAVAT
jgi:hypothetical protein